MRDNRPLLPSAPQNVRNYASMPYTQVKHAIIKLIFIIEFEFI